ncbi:MAG: hypothetical protein JXR83_20815 [Deltaproteobacteria bacterium]|nr:hypothetical protein [Deltaproteobacteria bacterium]
MISLSRRWPARRARSLARTWSLMLLAVAGGCEPVAGAGDGAADGGLETDSELPLAIVVQPRDQIATTGSSATFWVAAAPPSAVTYQWKKDGIDIDGATSAQYTTPPTASGDSGAHFTVTVSSGDNSVTSASATLTLDTSIDDLMALARDFRWSSSTPMGKHYEGLPVASDEDRAYLDDPDNQPPVPPRLEGSLTLRLFRVELYPSGTPIPADINQRYLGDCNGLSALASLAYQNPGFVTGLIADQGDGIFKVAMFDPQGQPISVTVNSFFLSDQRGRLAAVSSKSGQADWATVLEKAIMKYNVIFGAETSIEAIGSENVTPLFTGAGGSFAFDRGVLSADQISRAIEASLACGRFITGGFGQEIPLGEVYSLTAHGYACFWPTYAPTMVSMRNPWGYNPYLGGGYDTSQDGVLDVPTADDWARTIDLRVIDPGRAGSAGRTAPYAAVGPHTYLPEVCIASRIAPPGR